MEYDVIIIGSGPAGISASLYTARANLKTLIISKGIGILEKVKKIENYYGLSKSLTLINTFPSVGNVACAPSSAL